MIVPFLDRLPIISENVFTAPDSWIIGDVSLEQGASVFFGAVLRGDLMPIRIGANSNIQDHVVVHTSNERVPVEVAESVSVGHRAILHGCRIESNSMIGMGACILDEAHIGENCLIGAQSLVTSNTVIPDNSLVIGSPGRVIRKLSKEEIMAIADTAKRYSRIATEYRNQLK